MAIKEKLKEVKVVLDLTKGTQTISNCKVDASPDALYSMGIAVGDLHQETVERVMKITESELV